MAEILIAIGVFLGALSGFLATFAIFDDPDVSPVFGAALGGVLGYNFPLVVIGGVISVLGLLLGKEGWSVLRQYNAPEAKLRRDIAALEARIKTEQELATLTQKKLDLEAKLYDVSSLLK